MEKNNNNKKAEEIQKLIEEMEMMKTQINSMTCKHNIFISVFGRGSRP